MSARQEVEGSTGGGLGAIIARFEGLDERPATFAGLGLGAAGMVVALVLSAPWAWVAIAVAALVSIGSLGNRYQLLVGSERLEVSRRRWWRRESHPRRLLLDFDCQPVPRGRAFGLVLSSWPLSHFEQAELGRLLGEKRSQKRAAAIREAIETARSQFGVGASGLSGWSDEWLRFLDVESVEVDAAGRATGVRTRRPFDVRGVSVPAGSWLELERSRDWIDPRRPDSVEAIRVGAPTEVPGIPGMVAEGARIGLLLLDGALKVTEAGEGALEIEGMLIDPVAPIWVSSGVAQSFYLAAPWQLATMRVSRGAFVARVEDDDHDWVASVTGPTTFNGIPLLRGDVLLVDGDLNVIGCRQSAQHEQSLLSPIVLELLSGPLPSAEHDRLGGPAWRDWDLRHEALFAIFDRERVLQAIEAAGNNENRDWRSDLAPLPDLANEMLETERANQPA